MTSQPQSAPPPHSQMNVQTQSFPRREFQIPPEIDTLIHQWLMKRGWETQWEKLATVVQQLSEFYIQKSGPTPWSYPHFQDAYLAYFFPMNMARLKALRHEIQLVNFPMKTKIVDFGSGPGTSQLAWIEDQNLHWTHWETSPQAIHLHQELLSQLPSYKKTHEWATKIPNFHQTTVVASYSFTEFSTLPQEIWQADSLVIMEPSTQVAARRLMTWRETALQKKFYVWAPCTHQQSCPLLTHSRKDWCHDRIHFLPPSWWEHLSPFLPMENRTLTYSYLLLSRQSPPEGNFDSKDKVQMARVIGDTLFEKGKIKQAICRGPQREFLSWLTKMGEPDIIPHGQRILLPAQIQNHGSELRISRQSLPTPFTPTGIHRHVKRS